MKNFESHASFLFQLYSNQIFWEAMAMVLYRIAYILRVSNPESSNLLVNDRNEKKKIVTSEVARQFRSAKKSKYQAS
jgi:hypothetical protein